MKQNYRNIEKTLNFTRLIDNLYFKLIVTQFTWIHVLISPRLNIQPSMFSFCSAAKLLGVVASYIGRENR